MVDISLTTLAAAVETVKEIVKVYDGYAKGRFMKTDEAVRAEIQRRCEMISRHLERLQTEYQAIGERNCRVALENNISLIQSLRGEAQFSIAGSPAATHKSIGKLSSKSVRKLVDQDSMCLRSLVETTRLCNEISENFIGNGEKESLQMISKLGQKINRSRNMFLERNMFIDGLMKR